MSNLAEINDRLNVVHGSFRPNIFVRIVGKISVWRQRRAAIRELKAMSDSLLRDLGIERYQITDVVNQTGQFAELRPVQPDQSIVVPLQQAAA